jgi:hypothetical protein
MTPAVARRGLVRRVGAVSYTASRLGVGVVPSVSDAVLELAGGIAFPATQVPSSDANTLDDYEEGSWTPTLTAATPGDLAVAYSTQVGRYTKIGRIVVATCRIITSSWVHTTASGEFRIAGLPFAHGGSYPSPGALFMRGWTNATFTSWCTILTAAQSYAALRGSASAASPINMQMSDVPTGGTVDIGARMVYSAA